MNLYLIRHGKTLLNEYGKMQGWADSPLTEQGREVAAETGKKLADISFDRVYTSDLSRTVETAEILLHENNHKENLVIRKTKELRELFFGSLEGDSTENVWKEMAKVSGLSNGEEVLRTMSMKEITELFHKIDPLHHAETFEEFSKRIDRGLEIILSEKEKEEENILIVSHGVVIRHIIDTFSEEEVGLINVENCSVTHLEYCDGAYKLVGYNLFS